MTDPLVRQTCILIFEEDWDHFSERPTLVDAIERIVAKAIAVARTQHVSYSDPAVMEEATR